MKVLLPALFGLSTLFSIHAYAISDEQINDDCDKLASYAAAGNKAYKAAEYQAAEEAFRQQVAWSEFCELSESAIATAYNNVALTYIRRGEFLKAKAWIGLAPNDSKSKYNLKLIEKDLAKLPHSTSPAGEYWQYASQGAWNTLTITPEASQYKIEFFAMYFGLMSIYNGPNMGEFTTTADIKNNKFVYRYKSEGKGLDALSCTIDMTFSHDKVTLDGEGNCGFGHNVTAEGEFVRVTQ